MFEQALTRLRLPSYVYKGLGFFEADEIQDVIALLRYWASPHSNIRAAAFLRSRFVRLSDAGLQALAPRLAHALSAHEEPDVSRLDAEDRRTLALVRDAMARWLALVDRLPPADLLELALDESAYAFETRGPRARQARENLKKIRAMLRRIQNSGYATMSRIADHLERLSAGDESNAVIDAGDAVSLMTVHAAKGLEFPVVFVVNLSKGTGSRRPAIRVAAEGDAERAWISVGEFQSEADEDAREREQEETKRLLYVALTRARDRLYLASELKSGTFRPAPGSLGEVLPATLAARLSAVPLSQEPFEWQAASGLRHPIRLCRPMERAPAEAAVDGAPSDEPWRPDEPGTWPLPPGPSLPRVAVTAAAASEARPLAARAGDGDSPVERWSGRSFTGCSSTAARRSPAKRIAAGFASSWSGSSRRMELVGVELERAVRDAADAYLALCARPELREALADGEALFEVPFSLRPAGADLVLRGTFDCLVERRDGGLTLLELKTGAPNEAHRQQLASYLSAARALFPGRAIEARLIYG